MSSIRIYIPGMTDKGGLYAGEHLLNSARRAGQTLGVTEAKRGLYGSGLKNGSVNNGYLRAENSTYDNSLTLKASTGSEIELIAVLIDVGVQNRLVETSLVNRSGKVKEYIQREDFTVNVRGNLFCEAADFPKKDLQWLLRVLKVDASYTVGCEYLDLFDISRLVLKSASFNQSEMKMLNVLPFSLSFVSDTDYDFLLEED